MYLKKYSEKGIPVGEKQTNIPATQYNCGKTQMRKAQ